MPANGDVEVDPRDRVIRSALVHDDDGLFAHVHTTRKHGSYFGWKPIRVGRQLYSGGVHVVASTGAQCRQE